MADLNDRDLIRRPAVLDYGMKTCALVGPGFLLALLCAAFDFGEFTVNDETLSGPDFLRRAGAFMGTIALLLTMISVTLWRNSPLSRLFIVSFWVAWGVLAYFTVSADAIDFTWLAGFAVTAWYLYLKPNVVAYYRQIGDRSP